MGIEIIGVPVFGPEGYGGPKGQRRDIVGIEMENFFSGVNPDKMHGEGAVEGQGDAEGIRNITRKAGGFLAKTLEGQQTGLQQGAPLGQEAQGFAKGRREGRQHRVRNDFGPFGSFLTGKNGAHFGEEGIPDDFMPAGGENRETFGEGMQGDSGKRGTQAFMQNSMDRGGFFIPGPEEDRLLSLQRTGGILQQRRDRLQRAGQGSGEPLRQGAEVFQQGIAEIIGGLRKDVALRPEPGEGKILAGREGDESRRRESSRAKGTPR